MDVPISRQCLYAKKNCSRRHHEALITVSKCPQMLFKDISFASPVSYLVEFWQSFSSVIIYCHLFFESWAQVMILTLLPWFGHLRLPNYTHKYYWFSIKVLNLKIITFLKLDFRKIGQDKFLEFFSRIFVYIFPIMHINLDTLGYQLMKFENLIYTISKVLKVYIYGNSEEFLIWWRILDEREEMEKRESNAIFAESP